MIVLAAERRACVQQLADVLDVTPAPIRQQFKLLDGICSEAVVLLETSHRRHVPRVEADKAVPVDRMYHLRTIGA